MTTAIADIRKIPRSDASCEEMPERSHDYAESEERLLGEGLSAEQIALRENEGHAQHKELAVVELTKAAIAGAGVAIAGTGLVSIVFPFTASRIDPSLLNEVGISGAVIGAVLGFLNRRGVL